ncbi:restriction endonuclease subunit S [Companilactobacillus sp.]|uniref:restriction endonuclease subunit S n=1 Tax=Companilactobacillus sp. TaxID=2767905 RepID=UPI0025C39BC1|nr:restriction endonuclease subunit S [Companilactobacillus sp.]
MAWEQHELRDIGSAYSGLSGKSKQDFNHGDAKFITYLDVFQNTFSKIERTEKIEIDHKQNLVKYGDALFTISSETPNEVGMSSVWLHNDSNIYLNSFCFGVHLEYPINPIFLGFNLRTPHVRKQFIFLAQGISRFNISKKKALEISIYFPSNNEQREIGKILTTLESILVLYQDKLNLTVKLRNTIFHQLFPNKRREKTNLSFKNCESNWHLFRLGDLCTNYDNLRVPITTSKRIPGKTPYYGANGIQDFVHGYTHKGPFVLIAEDGANDLKDYPVRYVDGCFWANNHVHVLQADENTVKNKFLMYAIKSIYIEPFLVGGSRSKLNGSVLMDLKLPIPSLKFQNKTIDLLSSMDSEIDEFVYKIKKLNNLKSTLLQKMFI